MNPIIKKISVITACIAIFVFTVFAIIETTTFSRVLKETTDDKLIYETEQFANQMSMVFENAEGSVDALCAQVSHGFHLERQLEDPLYIRSYMAEYSPVIKDTLVDIEGSQGLYVTFSPEITDRDGIYEIWYSYDKEGHIRETDAMNNGIYYESFEDEDFPTMKYWFSAADKPGEGVWTEPYMDSDIGQEVMAYSRAVYIDDTLVGVVGTDIYTTYTTDLISNMKVENDGMIFLLDQNNRQIVSSRNVSGTGILRDNGLWDEITGKMEERGSGDFDVGWNGKTMRVSFSQLSNDWKLAIINYEDNLYRTYDRILMIVILLSLLLVALLAVAVYLAARYFSSPVDRAIRMLKLMDLGGQLEEGETEDVKDDGDVEALVKKAMERQRMNDIMLAHKSRQAAAGEMMGNVVHQWKQPLNNINIIMGMLKDDIENGEVTKESALSAVSKVERLTTGMSETLSDFSDYLKPDKEIVSFPVRDVVMAVMELLKDKTKARNIKVTVEGGEGMMSRGYKNSLYHVILNIVDNAIDAIEEKGAVNGVIRVDIRRSSEKKGKIAIEIFNDGAQISERSKERLFSPYYTTKKAGDGTGLGLAISKHFIEESMDGEITLENFGDGVRCVMTVREEGGEG
ncbi:ATP-binding protein [Gallibacter sp. Marseille-QA0791]|uniref:ATP-binding protein n=1 Tax=Gallibacter sp. Marseille-QA0791 TaxID=3378781 RepID=UPI003D0F5828